MAEVIAQPPGWPILGNLPSINMEYPLLSLCTLAKQHGESLGMGKEYYETILSLLQGEIYRMRVPGRTFIVASSHALVNELCDEKRFPKSIIALNEMRNGVHDGLFTVSS